MTSIDDGFPGLGASNSRRKKKNNNNKKKKTQISSLGKELFLMGLNYDGGITVTINNKSTTIMKNTPPHLLNEEYRRMFPKATPFICACEKGHLDDVQNLIWIEKIKLKELPANVRNFKFKTFLNTEGTSSRNVSFTPLCAAARYEHLKIVQLLIGNGADLSICSKRDGWNVLHFAAYYSKKNSNLVRYLLQKLDINMIIQKDICGETPLYYACKNRSSIKKGVIYTIEHNEKFKRYYEALRIKEERTRRREEEERIIREYEERRRREEEERRRREEEKRRREEGKRRREEDLKKEN